MSENDDDFSKKNSREFFEEKKRRIEIEKKSKQKRNTVVFLIVATVVELVVMLACMCVFYALILFISYRLFKSQSSVPFQSASIFAFVGGVVVGFISQKKIMRFFIDKLHLQDKLQDGIADHYVSRKSWMKKQERR
ncbi:MAG: hypothetical protein J6I73_00775 [Treponema sp.]|nr:hypothetical protein [Treponema sp.]